MKFLKLSLLAIILFATPTFSGCKKKDKTPEEQPTPTPTPTPDPLAGVSTGTAFGITEYSAAVSVTVSSEGTSALTAVGVCWNTSPNPTTLNSKTNNGAGIGTFTATLTNLQPGTTYYVRSYATNASGTKYGNEVSFMTISAFYMVGTVPQYVNCLLVNGTNTLVGTLNGIYSINGSNQTSVFNTSNPAIYEIIKHNTHIIATSNPGKIVRSADNGNTWQLSGAGFSSGNPWHIASNGNRIFSIPTNTMGILFSDDNGSSWSSSNGFATYLNTISSESQNVYGGSHYVGYEGVYFSTDGGVHWTQTNNTESFDIIRVHSGVLYGTKYNDLFKSTDNGANWTSVSNFPNLIEEIQFDQNHMFIRTYLGIYQSNNGNNFFLINAGLPAGQISAIYLFNSEIYVVCDGKLWKRPY